MAVDGGEDVYGLPEDCIANALSLTSPKDACRLSMVGSAFRAAAQSDAVWERFLPSDYRDIIARAVDGADSLLGKCRSKKDLYFHLSDHPILIDSGLKSFTLEKWSGKKCYMLAARDLSIVWGDSSQYWQWISLPESRFPEVAQLINVCWFEIRGSINTRLLSPGTNYATYLVFTTKSMVYGFNDQQTSGFVGISGREMEKCTVRLDTDQQRVQGSRTDVLPVWLMGRRYHRAGRLQHRQENAPMDDNAKKPEPRDDGWMEVELGEYHVKGCEDGDLEMTLMEVHGGNWKSGIIIQGIEIRPKNVDN